MFKNYIAYLKDNPEGYWFKRKLYGWGWTPATWQGWLIIGALLVFIICQEMLFEFTAKGTIDIVLFLLNIFFSVVAVLLICKVKGEKPKWQWGLPKR